MLSLKGIFHKVLHPLTYACAGTELGGGATLHQDWQGRHRPVKEEEVQWWQRIGIPLGKLGKEWGRR